jgi:hypothetical protein
MEDPHVVALGAYHKARDSRPVTSFPITLRMLAAYGWARYWERRAMRKEQKRIAAESAPVGTAVPSPEVEAHNILERI